MGGHVVNPRRALWTTAVILVFGFASVAGSQPDQKDHRADRAKEPAKAAQARQQRQAPAQNRQQQPAAQNRQQRQTPVQNRQQYQMPVQNRQQRPVTPDRNRLTTPPRQATQTPIQPRTSVTHVQQQTMWPRYRAQSWSSQHRTWGQRGGYNGYRIPGPRFTLYFGRPHRFHLSSYQVRIVGSYPQFYADGYWFTMLDPVPEYWDYDWYDRDYVTIVESDGGYYLLNEAYPDALLAISINLP